MHVHACTQDDLADVTDRWHCQSVNLFPGTPSGGHTELKVVSQKRANIENPIPKFIFHFSHTVGIGRVRKCTHYYTWHYTLFRVTLCAITVVTHTL